MKKVPLRLAALGAVTGLLAAMAPLSTALAATEPTTYPSTSDAPIYLMAGGTYTTIPAGTQLDWGQMDTVLLTSTPTSTWPEDFNPLRLPAPTDGARNSITFISAPGDEKTKANWKAYGDAVPLDGEGVLLPQVTPEYQSYGQPGAAAVKAAGGTYSLGVAYTKNNDLTVVSAYFTTINVDAGTGAWKFATPVVKTATTTALTASATTLGAGAPVTLTATVSPSSATGNVQFLDGSTSLGTVASVNGVATLKTTALSSGNHSITAKYAGDATNAESTSAAVAVTVNDVAGPGEAALVEGNKNGATVSVTGDLATITVGAANNGKTVNVFGYSDPSFLGQAVVSGGTVQVNVAGLAAGDHKLAVVDATDQTTILGWTPVTLAVKGGSATRDLTASVTYSADGDFKLIAPDNSTPALINNPTLDANGQSVSTGTLGAFSVVDDRGLTKKGWDLTTSVAAFTSGTNTIDNTALGLKPVSVSNAGPGSPVLGTEQLAGTAVYASRFAELAAGSYSPLTNLNADLTFKAPLGAKPGDYTSTLTLTLVSK